MAKRVRKAPVEPEMGQLWLTRYEAGESPPKIAEADGFDVRTVRKHIEQAKRKRELQQARATVLRNALESHYRDICEFTKKLDAQITAEAAVTQELREDLMWRALREHQPHIPLWNYLSQWNRLQQELSELQRSINERLMREVGGDLRLETLRNARADVVLRGIVAALAFQMECWGRDTEGLDLESHFRTKPTKKGVVTIEYGSFHMGSGSKEDGNTVREMVADWQEKVTAWQEYQNLSVALKKLIATRRRLKDELTIIILRRVVPGRCVYCPL